MSSTVLRDSSSAGEAAGSSAISSIAATTAGKWVTVAAITGFGLAIRIVPTIGTALPLNDGGLFVTMARDLQQSGFALPEFTSYNGDAIPFAYPPLGLYLLAAVSELLRISPVEVMRVLPVIFATALIPLVYLVASQVLRSALLGFIAALAFSVLPRAYEWLIVGGGVTRAPGFFFAVLAIWLFLRSLESRSGWHAASAGISLGLSGLTHPEAALFGAASIVLLMVTMERSWRAIERTFLAAAVALALVLPWLVLVLGRHGLDPLMAATASRDPISDLVQRADFAITGAPFLPILTSVGVAGMLCEVARGRYLLTGWVLLPLFLTPAAAPTFAMLPWAMLVAVAAGALRTFAPRRSVAVCAVVFLVASLATYLAPLAPLSPLRAMSAAELQALEWVRDDTDPTAIVLVVPTTGWGRDTSNEWLPSITGRHSLLTVQGYEWTNARTWSARVAAHEEALACSRDTLECFWPWLGQGDLIYVPKGRRVGPFSPSDCCPALRASLKTDRRTTIVYDGPGATIAAVDGSDP